MSAEIPAQATQALAEHLYRQYDSEFGADHLSWRDFQDQARELLDIAAPFLGEHIAAEIERVVVSGEFKRPQYERGGFYNDATWAAKLAREAFSG